MEITIQQSFFSDEARVETMEGKLLKYASVPNSCADALQYAKVPKLVFSGIFINNGKS